MGGRSRGIGNQVTKFFERYSLYCHPTPGAVLTVRLQVLLKLGLQPRADRRQLAVAACENNKSCKHRGGNACDLVMGARACWVIESDRCGSADRHSYDAMKDRRKASTKPAPMQAATPLPQQRSSKHGLRYSPASNSTLPPAFTISSSIISSPAPCKTKQAPMHEE